MLQRQELDHSYCCLSVQVQQYSVDSRYYPLTYGSPAAFGSEDDQTLLFLARRQITAVTASLLRELLEILIAGS